jgi:hypothetical protein
MKSCFRDYGKTKKEVVKTLTKWVLENPDKFKEGGKTKKSLSDSDKNDIYTRWKRLVNMSPKELEDFMKTEEGKAAGLSASEAKSQGIKSGRESARWILKMKKTSSSKWTPKMWEWANRQLASFLE